MKKPIAICPSFKKILDNAPVGATHFFVLQYDFHEAYGRLHDGLMHLVDGKRNEWRAAPDFEFKGLIEVKPLADIRTLVEVEEAYAGCFDD